MKVERKDGENWLTEIKAIKWKFLRWKSLLIRCTFQLWISGVLEAGVGMGRG